MEDFTSIQYNVKIAIKSDEGNSLVGVNLCTEKDDIMLSAKNGKYVRFLSNWYMVTNI